MWGWPLLYPVLDAVRNLEEAAYFSMETFTTLGYDHITLEKNWRLLSTFAAAKGRDLTTARAGPPASTST